MGITLYKKGNTHCIRGIDCEMQVFDESSFKHNLNDGWVFNPNDLVEETKVKKTKTKQKK